MFLSAKLLLHLTFTKIKEGTHWECEITGRGGGLNQNTDTGYSDNCTPSTHSVPNVILVQVCTLMYSSRYYQMFFFRQNTCCCVLGFFSEKIKRLVLTLNRRLRFHCQTHLNVAVTFTDVHPVTNRWQTYLSNLFQCESPPKWNSCRQQSQRWSKKLLKRITTVWERKRWRSPPPNPKLKFRDESLTKQRNLANEINILQFI